MSGGVAQGWPSPNHKQPHSPTHPLTTLPTANNQLPTPARTMQRRQAWSSASVKTALPPTPGVVLPTPLAPTAAACAAWGDSPLESASGEGAFSPFPGVVLPAALAPTAAACAAAWEADRSSRKRKKRPGQTASAATAPSERAPKSARFTGSASARAAKSQVKLPEKMDNELAAMVEKLRPCFHKLSPQEIDAAVANFFEPVDRLASAPGDAYRGAFDINGYLTAQLIEPSKVEELRAIVEEVILNPAELVPGRRSTSNINTDPSRKSKVKSSLDPTVPVIGGFASVDWASVEYSLVHRAIRILVAEYLRPLMQALGIALVEFLVSRGVKTAISYLHYPMERFMYRLAGINPSAESWHRDEAYTGKGTKEMVPLDIGDGDVFLGGWLSLTDYDQFFSGIPGTGRLSAGREGFAKLNEDQQAEVSALVTAARKRGECPLVRIATGQVFLFDQTILHEVKRGSMSKAALARKPQLRLFIAACFGASPTPMYTDLIRRLFDGMKVPLKSGQLPRLFPRLAACFNKKPLAAYFAANLTAHMKEHLGLGDDELPPPIQEGLCAAGIPFVSYSEEEMVAGGLAPQRFRTST